MDAMIRLESVIALAGTLPNAWKTLRRSVLDQLGDLFSMIRNALCRARYSVARGAAGAT